MYKNDTEPRIATIYTATHGVYDSDWIRILEKQIESTRKSYNLLQLQLHHKS